MNAVRAAAMVAACATSVQSTFKHSAQAWMEAHNVELLSSCGIARLDLPNWCSAPDPRTRRLQFSESLMWAAVRDWRLPIHILPALRGEKTGKQQARCPRYAHGFIDGEAIIQMEEDRCTVRGIVVTYSRLGKLSIGKGFSLQMDLLRAESFGFIIFGCSLKK